jgi:hypothetical protein
MKFSSIQPTYHDEHPSVELCWTLGPYRVRMHAVVELSGEVAVVLLLCSSLLHAWAAEAETWMNWPINVPVVETGLKGRTGTCLADLLGPAALFSPPPVCLHHSSQRLHPRATCGHIPHLLEGSWCARLVVPMRIVGLSLPTHDVVSALAEVVGCCMSGPVPKQQQFSLGRV